MQQNYWLTRTANNIVQPHAIDGSVFMTESFVEIILFHDYAYPTRTSLATSIDSI